jgi:putative membrane protein
MKRPKNFFQIGLRGLAMGVAEVIPGVSGGTIALITGIYERLLLSIRAFGPIAFKAYRDKGVRGAWEAVNGPFLLALVSGMALGLGSGVFGVTHILEHYPPLLWSFFFGLIIASSIYLGKSVKWNARTVVALLAGAGIAFWVTVVSPAQGSESLLFLFFSGMIAICAMLMPGISGSFVLLLLGMYTLVISSLKGLLETWEWSYFQIIAIFGAGCLVGMAGFSRLLTWLLRKYHHPTLAVLTGFLLGSLNKIWPWRNVLEYRQNSKGEMVPFREANVMPGQYEGDALVWGSLLLVVVGFFAVFAIERWGREKEA